MGRSKRTKARIGVAYIAGHLGLGGAEQQLYCLLSGIDRCRFRPMVISLGPEADEYWKLPIDRLDVPVYHISRFLGRLARIFRIARLLRSAGTQIVHGWVLHTNPYSALSGRLAAVPVRLGSLRGGYDRIPKEKLVRWTSYRGLDVLITNSEAAADAMQQSRLTGVGIRVVHNGIYTPDEVTDDMRKRLKTELGFSSSNLVIGSIGRIDGNKNHAMLLRVFARLTEKWNNLRLIIIGDGPMDHQLALEAKRLGLSEKISLPGKIPQAAQYLPAMDVCCLTSYKEGLSNLIMEASAAGLPVVSTTCGGTPELIEQGVTGYMVLPDDDLSMESHLDQLLANPEQRCLMGANGRRKMRSEFSAERMVARMAQVYEEAVAAKRLTV
jgi:glycosyltransferase involved in cell wall biosynthesis